VDLASFEIFEHLEGSRFIGKQVEPGVSIFNNTNMPIGDTGIYPKWGNMGRFPNP
jgi:hypothetical protein